MRAAHNAGELGMFLDQVEALVRSRAGAPDPLPELGMLGLLPVRAEPAPWDALAAADWHGLLRGMARACPGLAIALSGARLVHAHGGDPRRHGWAHKVRRAAPGERELELAAPPGSASAWYFVEGTWVRRVATPLLRPAAGDGGTWRAGADASACQVACQLPDRSRRPLDADGPALLSGILFRLWELAARHAESRPMFHRHLADFPAIRIRLIGSMAQVLRADEIAMHLALRPAGAAAGADAAALRLAAQAVRTELQQVCGGTGYMQDAAFAQALRWFGWCDDVARQVAIPDAMLGADRERAIERRVAQRLAAAGISSEHVRALLQSRGEGAAHAAHHARA